jgi:ubiquinone/menaquinone biosynthesis C-methylase UbiE
MKKHDIERKFHDKWAKKIKLQDINYKGAFESVTAVENRYALSQMGSIKGKKILDLGCGMGDTSLYFASKGARVYAVDISPGMIGLVKRVARKAGYSKNIDAKVMLAENLKFPSSYFDLVFGNGVLHHVVIEKTLAEVNRVLKEGGMAAFVEPLGDNPVINIYRKIAKKVRTPTEIPLKYATLDRLTNIRFKKFSHKEFHLVTLLIFLWFYLVERTNPNKERYWKKIIDDGEKINGVFRSLVKIDELIFKLVPPIKMFCWNTVLIYEK